MTSTSNVQTSLTPLVNDEHALVPSIANDPQFEPAHARVLRMEPTGFRLHDALTFESHRHLCAFLQGVGNVISPAHSHALKDTLAAFTNLAFERGGRQRVAIALPTGMGKTQSIVSWCKVAHDMGIVRPGARSVVVAASQIEALCTLKRDMISAGVPADSIGLHHTYAPDPAAAGWVHGEPPDGYRPPANRASIAADPDAKACPILLVTHARVGGQDVREFYEFEGAPRSLMIYDETLFRTEADALEWREVRNALTLAQEYLPEGEAMTFLSAVKTTLIDELDQQGTAETPGRNPQAVRFKLPEDLDAVRLAIQTHVDDKKAPAQLGRLLDQLALRPSAVDGMSAPLAVVRVAGHSSAGLIQFEPAVSDDLDNVAVLDASYHVRQLYKWDTNIKPVLRIEDELKTFRRVTINHYKEASGRNAVEMSLSQPRGSFYRLLVVEAVKAAVSPDGAKLPVLIFTFNKSGPVTSRSISCEGELEAALFGAGINLKEEVEVELSGKKVMKRRINFLTWGSETSRSDLKFCRVVIFAGVLHQDRSVVRARIAGQARDLTVAPADEDVRSTWVSETVHAVYQAASRGSCRDAKNGEADEMLVHLPLFLDVELEGVLEAMPGVRCSTIKPLWSLDPKVRTMVERMTEFLQTYDQPKVSFIAINRAVKVANARGPGRATLDKAYEFFLSSQDQWVVNGRTLVKKIVLDSPIKKDSQ